MAGVAVSNARRSTSRPYSPSKRRPEGYADPAGAVRLDRDDARLVAVAVDRRAERIAGARAAHLDAYVEPAVAELLGETVAPLDDRDGVVGGRVEVDVVDLGGIAEPVGVDVHQRRTADQRRMRTGDDERRRGDGTAYAEPVAEPLRERRLARAEVAREHQQVTRVQQCREPSGERLHVVGGRDLARQPQRLAELDRRAVLRVRVVEAPGPELHRLGQLLAYVEPDAVLAALLGGVLRDADHRRGDAAILQVGVDGDAAQTRAGPDATRRTAAHPSAVRDARPAGPPGRRARPRPTRRSRRCAVDGGSSAGRAAERAVDDVDDLLGVLGAGFDDVERGHRAASTRLSIASVTCLVGLEREHVAGVLDRDQLGAGDVVGEAAAVLERGQLVVRCRR